MSCTAYSISNEPTTNDRDRKRGAEAFSPHRKSRRGCKPSPSVAEFQAKRLIGGQSFYRGIAVVIDLVLEATDETDDQGYANAGPGAPQILIGTVGGGKAQLAVIELQSLPPDVLVIIQLPGKGSGRPDPFPSDFRFEIRVLSFSYIGAFSMSGRIQLRSSKAWPGE